jgi:folate-binding protein YgfZ
MFVLRSKVKLVDVSAQSIAIGVAGARARDALLAALGNAPETAFSTASRDCTTAVALPGDRYLLAAPLAQAEALWDSLAKHAAPTGTQLWNRLAVRAGEPLITAATQEQFVPQMVNFELIGGVNFQKGCYPGQEIVARSQYLGKVRRRMYLAHIDAPDVAPGDELFSTDLAGQASGTIVNAAPAAQGGCDALAVIQADSVQNQDVHWKRRDGPALRFAPLPYPVP